MGQGTTGSFRTDPGRKPTPEERARYWKNEHNQVKAELLRTTTALRKRDALVADLNLQLEIANQQLTRAARELKEYQRAFGFRRGDQVRK